MTDTPTPLSDAEMRKFGLTTGAIVLVLFAFLLPWIFKDAGWRPWPFNGEAMPPWPWWLACALWLPALLYPSALRPVYLGWMKVGEALGYVNSRIILFLFFYLILLPVGLMMRVIGHDPMRRKRDDSDSYRVESKPPTSPHSMERPY